MKVQITTDAKKWLTLAEAPIARQIVMEMKADETSAADWLKMAANAYTAVSHECPAWKLPDIGWPEKVLEASAEIAGNQRVNDIWQESGRLDIWIKGAVKFTRGYLEIGSYYTDIISLGSDEARDNLVRHSYTRAFAERK